MAYVTELGLSYKGLLRATHNRFIRVQVSASPPLTWINMKMVEIKNDSKSGIIPFYVGDDGQIRMLFMVPSDPYYGGPRLQIAKGGIDPGETAEETAVREGIEELGLRMSNVVTVKRGTHVTELVRGDKAVYRMEVFVAKIIDPAAFDQPHYETGHTSWLTLPEFQSRGRRAQTKLVERAYTVMQQIAHADGRSQVS